MISSPKGLMISTTLRAVMIYHYSVMDKKMTAILYQNYSHFLERITGLEPATSTLARSRSTKWAKSAKWCLRSESNQRHGDFQSPALPTGLQRRIGWRLGWGSNPRPLAWQASALTNWATKPYPIKDPFRDLGGKYMGSALQATRQIAFAIRSTGSRPT